MPPYVVKICTRKKEAPCIYIYIYIYKLLPLTLIVVEVLAKKNWYYCLLRSYKKGCFFLLFYVFFDVESESEVRFARSPLFLSYENNVLDGHEIQVIY